jgi:hypothetical protein
LQDKDLQKLKSPLLWKKAMAKALKSPPNVISGAVCLAASAALWNPLPLILWGLGATGWSIFASTGDKLSRQIADEEAAAAAQKAQAEMAALELRVDAMLQEPPVAAWMRQGALPDYRATYRRLVDVRDRVARVLAERSDGGALAQAGVLQQLDYMRSAYLSFVRERLLYLQILANIRPGANPVAGGAVAGAPAPDGAIPMPVRVIDRRGPASVRLPPVPSMPLPKAEERIAEIDAKIAQLEVLAEAEPDTARTRRWHIGILQKQREMLLDTQKRDQSVAAQLSAFADVFEVILGRVSASQISATEIASYMGSMVDQIEETERFVESLRPAMDQLIGSYTPG